MKLGIRSLLIATLVVFAGFTTHTVSAQTSDVGQVESLRAQIAVLQEQLNMMRNNKEVEANTTSTHQNFKLLSPNGGEIWEADGGFKQVTLVMPADRNNRRYQVDMLLMPQEGTPTIPPSLPGQSTLYFDPEFGGYHMGGFSHVHPVATTTTSIHLPEELPQGPYKLRIYLNTYEHGSPDNPGDYLMTDESDAQFLVLASYPTINVSLDFVESTVESPVGNNEARADYSIEFDVQADGHSVLIPRTTERHINPDSSSGIEYAIGQGSRNKRMYSLGTTTAAFTALEVSSGDTPLYFKVLDGQTRRFRLDVALNNLGGVAGFYNLQFTGFTVVLTPSSSTVIEGIENMTTDTVYVRTENTDVTEPLPSLNKDSSFNRRDSSAVKTEATVTDRKSL